MKVALIFGTRPEAIKMAPLVLAMKARPGNGLIPRVYVTGQHREMLDQVLQQFAIEPDADLDLMKPGQKLVDLTASVMTGVDRILVDDAPDLVLVHGDTTTAMAATLAAFYRQIPVGHVEAGLRTWNLNSPFPEEMNRQVVDRIARYHFAPTATAVNNLIQEGIDRKGIVQTGNTVIDALLLTLERWGDSGRHQLINSAPQLERLLQHKNPFILVTSHRRENHKDGLKGICQSLLQLVRMYPRIEVVFPVHPNPEVRRVTDQYLQGESRIHLIQPLDYLPFSYLLSQSFLVMTDSGGIQEEAPALHKPVLVLRDTSERPEAVAVGAAKVVGTQTDRIVVEASRLLDNPADYQKMANAGSPYGDGQAAKTIIDWLENQHQGRRAA